jgi:hypothetical protein
MVDGERLSVFKVNHWVQKSGHPCYRRLVANTDTHYGLSFLLGAALFYISPQQFVILPSLMPNSIIKYKMAVLFFSPLALYVSYRQKGAGTWLLSCFWVCSSFVPNKILDIVIPLISCQRFVTLTLLLTVNRTACWLNGLSCGRENLFGHCWGVAPGSEHPEHETYVAHLLPTWNALSLMSTKTMLPSMQEQWISNEERDVNSQDATFLRWLTIVVIVFLSHFEVRS